MDKVGNTRLFLIITYPIGVLIGLWLYLFKALGRFRVLHEERFPRWQENMILVSNHPSLLEPFLLPGLFVKDFLFRPLKFGPWSTPDRKNYYDPWYFFWIRPRSIPVDRNHSSSDGLRAFVQMKRVLKQGGRIILFAEGGRTSSEKGNKFWYSPKGKRIRQFKDGLGWLVVKTGTTVVPVWVEGSDRFLPNVEGKLFTIPRLDEKVLIKIGSPLRFSDQHDKQKVSLDIANALLRLADEEE